MKHTRKIQELKSLDWFRVKDLPGEVWKTIEDAPTYMISNKSRVKSKAYERFYKNKTLGGIVSFHPEHLIKQHKNKKSGYVYVSLVGIDGKIVTKTVHRLMGIYFIQNPDPIHLTDVCHKNEIAWDNRLENLYWGTHKENCNEENRRKRISESLSITLIGNQRRAKKVFCDGIVYSSAKIAATELNVNPTTLRSWLTFRHPMPERFKKMGLSYVN